VRKLVALPVAAVALGVPVVAGVAVAGEPSNTDGDHVILQVTVSPPVKSTAAKPVPVSLVLDSREYTDNGQRSTHPTRTNEFRFNGFRFHPNAFAKCLESKLEKEGPSACPKGSRLGKGYFIADARPTLPDPIRAEAQVFNGTLDIDASGKPRKPARAVLIYAQAANGIKAYVPVLFKGRDRLITAERTAPEPGQQPLYTLTAVHLTIPAKTKTVKGKTVGFMEAPRTCSHGAWNFSEVDTFNQVELPPLNARTTHDSQACWVGKWEGPIFNDADKN
jgi:hypothetical protein